MESETEEAKRFRSELIKRQDRLENQQNKNEALLRTMLRIQLGEVDVKQLKLLRKIKFTLKDGKDGVVEL